MQRALSSLNAFGSDTHALTWVGQSADAFKATFGPLPGRLQKLYVSYGEASDALSAYWPKLQAAQTKADAALRQAQDASVDITRAAGTADDAAADLKTAQAGTDPAATAAAQDAHDAAQKNLQEAKARLAALAATAHQAHDDLTAAAKECAKAIHHAQSDGIHNKHWWQHVGETLSDLGGHIAQWASDIGQIAVVLAPVLNGLAALTIEVPGLDVVTAGLAAADDLIAATAPEVITAGTAIKATGDGLQGHWSDLGKEAFFLAASRFGPKGKAPSEDAAPPGSMAAQEGNATADDVEPPDPATVGRNGGPVHTNVNDPRTFDPQTLHGMDPADVEGGIPQTWTCGPSKRGGGTVFRDPDNFGRQIRTMPGYSDQNRPDPLTWGPYVEVCQNGKTTKLPLKGNPTLGANP